MGRLSWIISVGPPRVKPERSEKDMEAEVAGLHFTDGPKGREPRNVVAPRGRTRQDTEASRRTQSCQRLGYSLVRVLVDL